MSKDQTADAPSSNASPFKVVLGGAGIGLLVAAAAVAFIRTQKASGSASGGKLSKAMEAAKMPRSVARPKMNMKGKYALGAFIRIIEHDTSRKMLLTVLRAMAKRAK